MFSLDQFQYSLPPELIAHSPAEPRDSSKLMVVNRQTSQISHHRFSDLPDLLDEHFMLVRNNTKVIPARLFGQKTSGGHAEILLVKHVSGGQKPRWECLTRPGLKPGQVLHFADSEMTAECISTNEFTRLIKFSLIKKSFYEELEIIGHTPVPPYIHWEKTDEKKLRQVYQTTFAKIAGSVAAPTAGLHFTPEVDQKLRRKTIPIEEITLHVGLGTFLPVREEQLKRGILHQEYYEVTAETAAHISAAKSAGQKILAVG